MLKGSDDSQKLIRYCVSFMMEITMLQHKANTNRTLFKQLKDFLKRMQKNSYYDHFRVKYLSVKEDLSLEIN